MVHEIERRRFDGSFGSESIEFSLMMMTPLYLSLGPWLSGMYSYTTSASRAINFATASLPLRENCEAILHS